MYLAAPVAEEEEEAVGKDQHEGHDDGVEVLVGDSDITNIYQKLQESITCRDIEVRHLEVVDHSLVGMLSMSSEDVTAGEETLGDGEAAVGEEYDDEAEGTDIDAFAGDSFNITHKKEEDDKSHGNASHIAGEAACLGAKVEEAENENGNHDGGNKLRLDKRNLEEVEIAESADNDKRISGEHAVDAIHEVIDV